MPSQPLRFGVVTPVQSDASAWREEVRRIADAGYDTVLMPDVPGWQPAPGPALAVAASITDLRVGSWVYASPLRPAATLAWEAHSLSELTDGRFELGIGTGRPDIDDLLRELDLPVLTPGGRTGRVAEVVRLLREYDGPDRHTPVIMAVRGPKARALALEVADMVTYVMAPGVQRREVEDALRELRAVRDLPVVLHVNTVGDRVEPFMAGPDTDPAELRAADSPAYLPADPVAAIEQIHRCREELGVTYVVIGSSSAATLAPVVAQLAGT